MTFISYNRLFNRQFITNWKWDFRIDKRKIFDKGDINDIEK